jgi:hypothetical protein
LLGRCTFDQFRWLTLDFCLSQELEAIFWCSALEENGERPRFKVRAREDHLTPPAVDPEKYLSDSSIGDSDDEAPATQPAAVRRTRATTAKISASAAAQMVAATQTAERTARKKRKGKGADTASGSRTRSIEEVVDVEDDDARSPDLEQRRAKVTKTSAGEEKGATGGVSEPVSAVRSAKKMPPKVFLPSLKTPSRCVGDQIAIHCFFFEFNVYFDGGLTFVMSLFVQAVEGCSRAGCLWAKASRRADPSCRVASSFSRGGVVLQGRRR